MGIGKWRCRRHLLVLLAAVGSKPGPGSQAAAKQASSCTRSPRQICCAGRGSRQLRCCALGRCQVGWPAACRMHHTPGLSRHPASLQGRDNHAFNYAPNQQQLLGTHSAAQPAPSALTSAAVARARRRAGAASRRVPQDSPCKTQSAGPPRERLPPGHAAAAAATASPPPL